MCRCCPLCVGRVGILVPLSFRLGLAPPRRITCRGTCGPWTHSVVALQLSLVRRGTRRPVFRRAAPSATVGPFHRGLALFFRRVVSIRRVQRTTGPMRKCRGHRRFQRSGLVGSAATGGISRSSSGLLMPEGQVGSAVRRRTVSGVGTLCPLEASLPVGLSLSPLGKVTSPRHHDPADHVLIRRIMMWEK